jgi:hypothetical protein
MFQTDDYLNIIGQKQSKNYRILVTATNAGVSVPKSNENNNQEQINASNYVIYNIVLETLFFGIPYDAGALVMFTLVVLLLALCLFVPQIMPMVIVYRKQKTH